MSEQPQSFASPLSQLIWKEYTRLVDAVSKVSPDVRAKKILDGTGGKVSVSDVIAYQIGWGKFLINWYETGERGEIPIMPGDGFTKWDYTAIAKHFYQKYPYDQGKKQDKEFDKVVNIIINEIVE